MLFSQDPDINMSSHEKAARKAEASLNFFVDDTLICITHPQEQGMKLIQPLSGLD